MLFEPDRDTCGTCGANAAVRLGFVHPRRHTVVWVCPACAHLARRQRWAEARDRLTVTPNGHGPH